MSNSVNQLGGKCSYMPFLGSGQKSGGGLVLHSDLEAPSLASTYENIIDRLRILSAQRYKNVMQSKNMSVIANIIASIA